MKPYLLIAALVICGGCQVIPLKGGKSTIVDQPGTNGFTLSVQQPENPLGPATQNYEKTDEKTLDLPAGTKIVSTTISKDADGKPVERKEEILLDKPTKQTIRTVSKADSKVGASQKDNAREIGAKMDKSRWVQGLGILLILGALAMFHPAVKAITMSTTLQMVTGIAGLALVFGPILIIGHEGMLIWMVALAVGLPAAYFFIWKHGHLQAIVNLKDDDKDGVDDRVEQAIKDIEGAMTAEEVKKILATVEGMTGSSVADKAAVYRVQELIKK